MPLSSPSQVDASVRSYMSGHILHVHPAQSQTSSVPEQQYQLYPEQTACRTPAVRPRDQDDPHDDAHPEGENSAKRQKTSEYEAYVSGESSSGQVFQEEQAPSTSGNQEQDDDFDFWTDSYASDDDEIPTKQVSQDIMEEVSLTIDEAKLRKMADEMLRQRCTSGDEHQYHIDQMKNFLKSDIVWEYKKRRKFLKENSGPEKIVLSLHKFPAIIFNDDDIEERTSRWPDYKNLNKNDIEDIYLLIMNGKVPDYADTRLLLKPALQCALLRSNPTTLSEAFSLARATEARFAKDTLSKLLQMGTVAKYQNKFEMLIKRVTGISESLLKSFYISGLKPALQIELLRARPTSLEEAFSLARITEARFEDERSTTAIAKTNDLNTEQPIQDLEEMIRHKPKKVKAFKTSMVATSEELEQQEYQDDLNEISEELEQQEYQDDLNEISEEKDDAQLPISADTFGTNGGNDSETTGPEAPVKEVVDNGIESEEVVGLLGMFQEGDMVDALSRVEQKCLRNWKELDNESKERKVEMDAKREGESTILATFDSDRGITIWDPEIKSAFQDNTMRAMWF
ncbi:hypothetical protein Tco_1252588 [Tanacetum coccineum]